MAFYEVVRVAAWLVCGVVGLFTRSVNKSSYATNRRSGVLPFLFWRRGKKYEKTKRLTAGQYATDKPSEKRNTGFDPSCTFCLLFLGGLFSKRKEVTD